MHILRAIISMKSEFEFCVCIPSNPRTGHFLEDKLMLHFTASTGIIRCYYPHADKYNFGCIIQYSLIHFPMYLSSVLLQNGTYSPCVTNDIFDLSLKVYIATLCFKSMYKYVCLIKQQKYLCSTYSCGSFWGDPQRQNEWKHIARVCVIAPRFSA